MIDVNEAKRLYEEGNSLQDIGEKFNCTRQNIFYALKGIGVKLRTKEEARQLVYDQGKIKISTFNENVFDKWSNKSAYLLGLLYTDGSMSYTYSGEKLFKRISFAQKDKGFMDKVANLFEFNSGTGIIPKNEFGVHNISMSSNYMCDKLEKLGLYPNKSLTIRFPNIPKKYYSHFIRGVFDGDGSINKTDGRINIVSGSKEFINDLYDVLLDNNIQPRKYHYEYSNIKIGRYIDRQKFFHFIYKNKEDMFFDRKYNIFIDKGLDIIEPEIITEVNNDDSYTITYRGKKYQIKKLQK